jgi:AraC-like DNA-binding protein
MNLLDEVLTFNGNYPTEVLMWNKTELPEDWYLAPNILPRHAIVVLTRGRATFFLENKAIGMKDGDALLIKKGQVFASEKTPHPAFECSYVHFRPLPDERILHRDQAAAVGVGPDGDGQAGRPASGGGPDEEASGRGLFISPESRRSGILIPTLIELGPYYDAVAGATDKGLAECRRPRAGSSLHASICLAEVFIALTRRFLSTVEKDPLREGMEKKGSTSVLVQDAVYRIRSDYAQTLSVQSTAAALRVTPQHLIRSFRKTMGISPLDYIHTVRMERAREMLRMSRLSIKEIAAAVGFPDQRRFARLFSRTQGVSPTAYREKSRR